MASSEIRDERSSFKKYCFPNSDEVIACIEKDKTTKLFSSYMFIVSKKQYNKYNPIEKNKKEFILPFVISMDTYGVIIDSNITDLSSVLKYCFINVSGEEYFAFEDKFSFAIGELRGDSIDKSNLFIFENAYTRSLLIRTCDFSIEYPEYYQKYTAIVGMRLFRGMDVTIYNDKFYFNISREDITRSPHGVIHGFLQKYFPSNSDCMERNIELKKEGKKKKKNRKVIHYNKVNVIQLNSIETTVNYSVKGEVRSFINHSYYLENFLVEIRYYNTQYRYIDNILLDSTFTGGICLPNFIDIDDNVKKEMIKDKWRIKGYDLRCLNGQPVLSDSYTLNDDYQIQTVYANEKDVLFNSRNFLGDDIAFSHNGSTYVDKDDRTKHMLRMGLKCFGGCGFINDREINSKHGENINYIFFKCGYSNDQPAFLFAFMQNEKPKFILDNDDPIETTICRNIASSNSIKEKDRRTDEEKKRESNTDSLSIGDKYPKKKENVEKGATNNFITKTYEFPLSKKYSTASDQDINLDVTIIQEDDVTIDESQNNIDTDKDIEKTNSTVLRNISEDDRIFDNEYYCFIL